MSQLQSFMNISIWSFIPNTKKKKMWIYNTVTYTSEYKWTSKIWNFRKMREQYEIQEFSTQKKSVS